MCSDMSFLALDNLVFLFSIILGVGMFHYNFLTLVDVLDTLVAAPVEEAEVEVQNLPRKMPHGRLGILHLRSSSIKGRLPPKVVFH